jgi:hypothetical protein
MMLCVYFLNYHHPGPHILFRSFHMVLIFNVILGYIKSFLLVVALDYKPAGRITFYAV